MVKKEDGQSIVELALALPIVLLLLIGIIDFGRVMLTHLELELINQESVRMGGLGRSDEEIRTYVRDRVTLEDPSQLAVNITPSGTRRSGTLVTVELTYPERFLEPLGELAIPYTIETSSTIRVE
ncbi:TadE/TadG family type IV pilus assembly protein [Bacillus thermotolerans]|uniref:TadE/TadG family type IV pilus assembly protein n=1 Tax=Bacillus thermotolerans TaxID=1221996 RepID=UPI00057C47F8|nr:TadE/TadG family type IV pilus assembly protein [Bacillus thermotolerans]KKB33104.1 TadZ/CpaE protein [Bacillus thermotolerans]